LAENHISNVDLILEKNKFLADEDIVIKAKFSIQGTLRDSFNEKNWTRAYNKNDVMFKLKYGIKLVSGGLRKHVVGKPVDTYRKASIFWTRNPKLVNPMKERRIWVQVAKNFEPFIRLTEEEVRQELLDFEEVFSIKANDLGAGQHMIGAEVFASWQKHDYIEQDKIKNHSEEVEVNIN